MIYVLKGKARMRWGDKLEFTAEAGPGDFIYVPPYVPVSLLLSLESIGSFELIHTTAPRDKRL